jgi:hypothetical protein
VTSAQAASSPGYKTCIKCGGDGYQPLPFTRSLYRYPCRACKGRGERPRPVTRIYHALRHGAKTLTEGEY